MLICGVHFARFKLYQHMDDDHSGKITYREFSGMCREELKLKAKDVSDARLQGAWSALDDDGGGFITAGAAFPFARCPSSCAGTWSACVYCCVGGGGEACVCVSACLRA